MEPHQNIALSFKCPKQLNQLHPVNGDYYCDGCQKTVHDFRGMTEAQVLEAMSKSARQTCGIFEKERITVLPQMPRWLKWASAAMMFFGVTSIHENVLAQTKKTIAKSHVSKKTEEVLVGAISAPLEPEPEVIYREIPQLTDTDKNRPLIGAIMPGMVASYPGGETALKQYLVKNIENPHHFIGNAIALFTIEKDGSLSNIKIIKSAGKPLDASIITALKHMPKWRPGIQSGKPTKVQYTLPINFSKQ